MYEPSSLVTLPLLPAPLSITLCLTDECNLRCRTCHLWTLKDAEDRLTKSEIEAIARNIGSWTRGMTAVRLAGGEPLVRHEEFLAAIRIFNACGVPWDTYTAGTLLTPEMYDDVLDGTGAIALSLDSPLREIHDQYRGREGTFDSVTSTVRGLAQRRAQRSGSRMRIHVTTILANWSFGSIFELIELVRGLGADAIEFAVLAPTFANVAKVDKCYERERVRERERIEQTFDRLEQMAANDPFLPPVVELVSLREIMLRTADDVWPDIAGGAARADASGTRGAVPAEPARATSWRPTPASSMLCGSSRQNLIVKPTGDILLCHEMYKLLGRPVGNVRQTTLEAVWTSEEARRARQVMETCGWSCGGLSCHRKPTFERVVKAMSPERFAVLVDVLERAEEYRDDAAELIVSLERQSPEFDAQVARALAAASPAALARVASAREAAPG